jgi:ubiquinone/menaquinone biosynthesis C-methylase UbiE
MKTRPELPAAYDSLVDAYDESWSVHVREPQQRLTRDLQLRPGLRCADIGCGTGTDTVEMLRLASPGEMVAVDCSPQMLSCTQLRARKAGLSLTVECRDAATFILESAGFDVVSLATHPLLSQAPQHAVQMLWARFAEILESQRTPAGIPLDFDIGGLVARRGL